MRRTVIPLLAVLCLGSGCLNAVRRAEQAVRRGDDARDRPAPAKLPDLDEADTAVVPGHPRLFVGRDWPEATDDLGRDWRARLVRRADEVLGKPPLDDDPRQMLARAREALRRISLLAGVYRFTHDRRYAEAGRREIADVCRFDSWRPDDFLATAEMMTAVSVGYDWLHETMPAAERKAVVAGLVRLGLRPALRAYDTNDGWTTVRHNWNLVCNGGTIVAALAVAEEEPDLAKNVLRHARESIRYGLSSYDAGGGTVEGPMYHSYATRYLTFAAAALETATGGRASLTRGRAPTRGKSAEAAPLDWTRAAEYRLAMTGPSGKVANFGDGGDILGNTAWVLWLARLDRRAEYVAFQTAADRSDPSAFDLLWYAAPGTNGFGRWDREPRAARPDAGERPRPDPAPRTIEARAAAHVPERFDGVTSFDSAVVLRGPTADPDAAFLALRTGRTDANHSHLDLGGFVLDVLGERFACDLGADSYDLPGYLHDGRPKYLRTSTPGHNTLSFGDDSQPLGVGAKVLPTRPAPGVAAARLDLSDAYPDARDVTRTATLDGRTVTITDELTPRGRARVTWHLHTPAAVRLIKGGAILTANGRAVELRVVSPAGASFTAAPDVAPEPQQPVEGITHVRLTTSVDGPTRIVVEFRPR